VFVARTAREYGLRPSRLAWWSSPFAWIEEGGERGGAAAAFASFGLDVPSGDDIDHRRTSSDYTRRYQQQHGMHAYIVCHRVRVGNY
jgi:hypothetical protein